MCPTGVVHRGTMSTSDGEQRTDVTPDRTTDHIGPIGDCPGCRQRDFLVHRRGDCTIFECLSCASSWRYELGYVWAVPTPDTAR